MCREIQKNLNKWTYHSPQILHFTFDWTFRCSTMQCSSKSLKLTNNSEHNAHVWTSFIWWTVWMCRTTFSTVLNLQTQNLHWWRSDALNNFVGKISLICKLSGRLYCVRKDSVSSISSSSSKRITKTKIVLFNGTYKKHNYYKIPSSFSSFVAPSCALYSCS